MRGTRSRTWLAAKPGMTPTSIPANVETKTRVCLDLAAESTRESPRRYLGSCYEAKQRTKAHERERTSAMQDGNGRFQIDIKSGRPLYAMDAIQDRWIEKLKARYIGIVACASDNKIDLHVVKATLPIPHLELHALTGIADLNPLVAHMDRHFP